jgi:pimeloyl-ACP methyl ester carboxylesterase
VSTTHFDSGTTASGIYYEIHGSGRPLFLGFPIMASHGEVFGAAAADTRAAFLSQLTDRYRVVVADYPNIGKSQVPAPEAMTIGRVCSDLLSVADAAGFERFAYWGGTFGAIAGLHLAAYTRRLAALVCVGWPPLDAPYAQMLRGARASLANPPMHARVILRAPEQYAQWITFYESLASWSDAEAMRDMSCPRVVFYGEHGHSSVADIPLPLADTIRERRDRLESMGWRVDEIKGADSALILDAYKLVPVVRRWLDAAYDESAGTFSDKGRAQ